MKLRKMRTAKWPLFLGVCLLILTGCGTTNTKYKTLVVSPQIPEQLLVCADSPPPPLSGTQRDAARYILKLFQNREECAGKLKSVATLLREFEEINKEE